MGRKKKHRAEQAVRLAIATALIELITALVAVSYTHLMRRVRAVLINHDGKAESK